jgi:hypothetical protein
MLASPDAIQTKRPRIESPEANAESNEPTSPPRLAKTFYEESFTRILVHARQHAMHLLDTEIVWIDAFLALER